MENIKQSEVLYTVDQIVFKYKFNDNTRQYLNKKYKDSTLTLTEWKNNFKKDGLKF